MSKILELESNPNPENISADSNQDNIDDIDKIIRRLLEKAYIVGTAAGMRTMSFIVLSQMKKNQNLDLQDQLLRLRKLCEDNVSKEKETT